jgi:hypothetical protein
MNRKQSYIYYFLLFLTAVVAMWHVAILQHPLKYDMTDQAYQWRYFIGQCLQEGILPLWNPYQLLGSPIHADPQSSAWYPFTWLFGYTTGYNIYTLSIDFMVHIFLAGMGMFYMAKQLKFRDETAFLMGVSYMLSGFFIGNAQHYMWIISGTWIPFIIGAFLSLKENPSTTGAIKLGLAFFMIMTGGYPAFIFLLAYLLVFIYILFLTEYIKKKDYKGLIKFSGYLAFAAVFTILAGMVILVSVYHVQGAITRGGGVTIRQALFGAFTPQSFISFIFPFASIRDMEFYGTDLSMSNGYIGMLMLIFFIAALMIKRTKLVNLFLAWGLFCLAASVGSALPVREFLYDYIPFMNLFRFPALFRVFFILSFIIVGGYAFNEWRSGKIMINRKAIISVLGIGGLVLGFLVYAVFKGDLNMKYFIFHQLFIFTDKTTITQHIFFQGLIQLVFLAFIILVMTLWKQKKHAMAGLLLIACLDLVLAARLNGAYTVYYQGFKSKEIYDHSKTFPDGFPLPDDRPVYQNRDTKGLVFQALWRNMNIFHKQVSWEGYNPLHLKGFEEMADNHVKLFETILQNPLVYLAENVSPLDSLPIHEKDSSFSKGRVYLEEEDYLMLKVEGLMLPARTDVQSGGNAGDFVQLKSFSPVEVKAISKTKDKAIVNLLQNKYYGWKAKIDGRDAQVFTGNMSFLAVLVPAGEHEVVFYYDPKGVSVGFWISIITILAGLFLISFTFFNHRGSRGITEGTE